ncbi:flagellar M-ring protein FliF [Paenibacillus psychroresistens]|uniref:Flagellar M-ring protein n=1 Tax=Paenibacillus psychroresistens TaxID=1778678 RepID=A0A6B8RLJ5_9BACL|nr:flagellar basal-body MS-ring/collar protein FliF [Paenibacillus psychroresistens]QGQ96228.1 flagellar M-ring protein FliF [Paenibacillus psychroresistens]
MNETLLQYWNRTTQYWNQLSRNRKISIGVGLLLFILVIVIVISSSSKTEYALAYTDLQTNDAAAITTYLKESGIPYKISPDNKSIQVPRSKVSDVQLAVESQGINKSSSIGYEMFRTSGTFGTTDQEFNMKKKDALNGEIQKLINSIEAVGSSQVLINLPEETLFLPQGDTSDKATASVVIQIKNGYKLDQANVDLIYNLVSKSIKNLSIENITIGDSDGNTLGYSKSGGVAGGGTGEASNQFAIKKAFEQSLQASVKTILGGILGNAKVIPMVIANINFDQRTSVEKLVTPVNLEDNTGIAISIQDIQNSYESDGGTDAGVAGTGSTDVPGYPGSTGSTGKTTKEENQKTVNNEVNHYTNEIKNSPFTVTDISLSVGIEPPDKTKPESLTQPVRDDIQKILLSVVSASLGNSGKVYTEDELAKKVTVFAHTFAELDTTTDKASSSTAVYIGIGILALIVAAIVGFVFSRRRKTAEAQALAEMAVSTKAEFPTLDFDQVGNDSQVRKQLEQLAKKKPDEFVNLLRTWLVDE